MRESLASPNDRLRTVAYSFFEHNPDRAMLPPFLTALDKEQAEFVRPALIRALAAVAAARRVTTSRVRARRWSARSRAARTSSAARSSKRSATTRRSTRSTRSPPSPSSTARCRTMRRWRWARSATSARSRRSPRLQRTAPRTAQPSIAAGDLSARRQLRIARELSRRDAEVRRQEPRLPGAAARRRRRPRRARRRRPRGRGRRRCSTLGIPSQGSDPRAGRARARRPSRCATRR